MKFDLEEKTLTKLAKFPFQLRDIGLVSPDGTKSVTSVGMGYDKDIAVLDLDIGKFEQLPTTSSAFWLNDDSIVYNQDVMDSEQRGTWVYQFGKTPRRILDQPLDKNGLTDQTNAVQLSNDDFILQIGTATWRLDPNTMETKLLTREAWQGIVREFTSFSKLDC